MRALPGFVLVLAAASLPGNSPAQTLDQTLAARRESLERGKHAWQETWLAPESGVSAPAAAEVRKFAGRVTVYQEGDRERIELRAVRGNELEAPTVVVSDGEAYWLVTQVGATPLVESAKASDPWLGQVLSGPAGDAPPQREVAAEGGGVAFVVIRAPELADFDESAAFALRLAQGGGGLRRGLDPLSPAGNATVTAAAGARGVGQVQTANGTVSVTPDPGAVRWMEAQHIAPLALEEFRMEYGLAPYGVLPKEPGT